MYDIIDQKKVIYITFAVILFISALVAPAALFYPAKAMFITPQAMFIGTSYMSLITGGLGLAIIASALLVLATVEMRLKKYLAAGILFLAGMLGLSFSLADYYYMTNEEFTYNAPFSFSESRYGWDDFEKIEEHIGKQDNTSVVESITLHLKSGEVIEMSSGQIFTMSSSLINYIEQAGGKYERIGDN